MIARTNMRFARGVLAAGLIGAVAVVLATSAQQQVSPPRASATIDVRALTAATDTARLPVLAIENPI